MGLKREHKSIENMKELYLLAKKHKWEEFHEFFSKNPEYLTQPIDVTKNTPLHRAAFCGKPEIFDGLLELLIILNSGDKGKLLLHALGMKNEGGNTVLHEVASLGDLEMAESIHRKLRKMRQQLRPFLSMRNNRGKTPQFRAAAHGRTKFLEHFHESHQPS